jgi:hypothetical protein
VNFLTTKGLPDGLTMDANQNVLKASSGRKPIPNAADNVLDLKRHATLKTLV